MFPAPKDACLSSPPTPISFTYSNIITNSSSDCPKVHSSLWLSVYCFSSSVDDVTTSSEVAQQPESDSNVPIVSSTPTTVTTTTTYFSSSELLLESFDETWPLFDNNDLIGCSFDILLVPSCLEMLDVVDEHNYALQKVLPEDSPSNVFVAVC